MAARRAGDPNFPDNLDIAPSSGFAVEHRRTRGRESVAADAQDAEKDDDDARQDVARFGIAGRTWEAAYLLRSYCSSPPDSASQIVFDPPCPLHDAGALRARTTVVELGAGTGFLSLAIAPSLPSTTRLVMTDLDNVCPLLAENLARAETRWAARRAPETPGPAESLVRPLPWGDRPSLARLVQTEHLSPDLILASDLIYFEFLYAPLLRTLIALTEPAAPDARSPPVLFSYKIRSLVREEPFWRAFGRWFAFDPVQSGRRPVERRRPSSRPPDGEDSAGSTSRPERRDSGSAKPVETVWSRYGSSRPSAPSGDEAEGVDQHANRDEDDDELYVFVCRRHPSTFGALPDLEAASSPDDNHTEETSVLWPSVSDEALLLGLKGAKGYELGATRFEEILLANLQWD